MKKMLVAVACLGMVGSARAEDLGMQVLTAVGNVDALFKPKEGLLSNEKLNENTIILDKAIKKSTTGTNEVAKLESLADMQPVLISMKAIVSNTSGLLKAISSILLIVPLKPIKNLGASVKKLAVGIDDDHLGKQFDKIIKISEASPAIAQAIKALMGAQAA